MAESTGQLSKEVKELLGKEPTPEGRSAVEVTKDEADQEQFDGLQLSNRDPNYHYRFARKSDMAIARHKFNGYEVVDSTSDEVRSILTDSTKMRKGADVDTTIAVGDLVLMRIPREKYEENMRRREERIRRVTRGVAASARRNMDSAGGARLSFEEHRDNPSMKGMSEKAYDRLQRDMAEEARERHEREARNR